MNSWEAFYGPNVGYAVELYERYLQDPGSVDVSTRAFFDALGPLASDDSAVATLARPTTEVESSRSNGNGSANVAARGRSPSMPAVMDRVAVLKVVAAARLARGVREYGHLAADIDPLGAPRPGDPMIEPATHHITDDDLRALPASIVWPSAGPDYGNCLDAIRQLRSIYCGSIGYEFDHVQDYEERAWLHTSVEAGKFRTPFTPEQQRALLWRLTEVEGFERFIHTTYPNQKRFSIEGNDVLIPMLDELVNRSRDTARTAEVLIGMAHRGRLNVLTHVLGKPAGLIFAAFHTAAKQERERPVGEYADSGWTGDVKYHLGWHKTITLEDGRHMDVTLADNPSHLEIVNPVVAGFARAAQDERTRSGAPLLDVCRALAVTIHGDAAFPGEGVVAETLNLSRLPGYGTGGTVRIIVNNQVGFTTRATDGRSTLYASDLAKGFEIPIVHVNADDPEACFQAVKLAHAYRDRFQKDFLIDLIGYRRWGHNEGDEPTYTQPRMYATISRHPTVRALYADRLVADGIVTAEDVERMREDVQTRMRQARDEAERAQDPPAGQPPAQDDRPVALPSTQVPADVLRTLNEALLARPAGFALNPRLERILSRRREAIDRDGAIDWAMAEALAFATILADGTPIRLAGQDTERGTFSQRHLVLHDTETGKQLVPLQGLPQARASFAIYNSPLTESAVMGFEYGYSLHAPEVMVLWEAQFGDFANVGQVIIDQFIAAAGAKWQQRPALTLLLPHGYEGQGPEHSSARLERFLQLAAEDNMRVVNCTTAAQYFHVLRLQAATLSNDRRPLVVLTPKSLLRHPRAGSSLRDLAENSFRAVIDTTSPDAMDDVERVILCSGKVAIDLATTAESDPVDWVSVVRVEQLYPFPEEELARIFDRYPKMREVIWLQEEPENMGAWRYIEPYLRTMLAKHRASSVQTLRYIGRPERASTAEGSSDTHDWEQSRIVDAAFEGERVVKLETRGVQNVG